MLIRSRAPLRLGLAGGGTDVSPYCDKYGGYVLNGAIDRYAYTVIKLLVESENRFIATDNLEKEILPLEPNYTLSGKLNLHKAVYNHFIENYNNGVPISLELSTYCDAPIGSGLGSSSTIVVSMVKAFIELLNIPLDDYAIANLAYKIERVDCGLQGGKQDQFSATFGGFNFMEFYDNNRCVINSLRIKNWIICELEASIILYYTGVSRESSRIIQEQSKSLHIANSVALNAMHSIKSEAVVMKEAILRGDFESLVDSVKNGWHKKKATAKNISNSSIDMVYESALSAGALGGKVSGAGGGGFMWFFVKPDKRMDVIRALKHYGGEVSNCHFTKSGAQAWRIL